MPVKKRYKLLFLKSRHMKEVVWHSQYWPKACACLLLRMVTFCNTIYYSYIKFFKAVKSGQKSWLKYNSLLIWGYIFVLCYRKLSIDLKHKNILYICLLSIEQTILSFKCFPKITTMCLLCKALYA